MVKNIRDKQEQPGEGTRPGVPPGPIAQLPNAAAPAHPPEAAAVVRPSPSKQYRKPARRALEARFGFRRSRKEKGPSLLDRRLTSLYIDDTSLRLLVTKGRHAIKWAEVPLKPGLVSEGVVTDPDAVADIICQVFREKKIRGKQVIASMSGLHCLSRIITLPPLSWGLLGEAVRREAERELPVSLDNLYLGWQAIAMSREEVKVFLVGYSRSIADAMVETLRRAGLKPHIMDLSPLALTRVVGRKTAVILDVRSTELDLVIMVDGVPELIRSLPLPREQSAGEKLAIVREELERTIKFYDTAAPRGLMNEGLSVYAAGELLNSPELLASLQEGLGHEIRTPAPGLRHPAGLSLAGYLVNIGLILKELEIAGEVRPSRININALPDNYRRHVSMARVAGIPAAVLVAAGALFLGWQVYNSAASLDALRNDLDIASRIVLQRQALQKTQTDAIAALEKQIAEASLTYTTFADAAGRLAGEREIVRGDLPMITAAMPPGVAMTGLRHSLTTVSLSGKAPDEQTVLGFADALMASGRYSEVVLGSIVTNDTNSVNFVLTLKK